MQGLTVWVFRHRGFPGRGQAGPETGVGMTKEGQWRVRMSVFELIADLGFLFGRDVFIKSLQSMFLSYLSNTAAEVRKKGYEKAALMGEAFGNEWIMNEFIPEVLKKYGEDKKGYNYRMCCLLSLAAVMPYMTKE